MENVVQSPSRLSVVFRCECQLLPTVPGLWLLDYNYINMYYTYGVKLSDKLTDQLAGWYHLNVLRKSFTHATLHIRRCMNCERKFCRESELGYSQIYIPVFNYSQFLLFFSFLEFVIFLKSFTNHYIFSFYFSLQLQFQVCW